MKVNNMNEILFRLHTNNINGDLETSYITGVTDISVRRSPDRRKYNTVIFTYGNNVSTILFSPASTNDIGRMIRNALTTEDTFVEILIKPTKDKEKVIPVIDSMHSLFLQDLM